MDDIYDGTATTKLAPYKNQYNNNQKGVRQDVNISAKLFGNSFYDKSVYFH